MVLVDKPFEPVGEAAKPLTNVEHWVDTDGLGGDSGYERGLAAATPSMTLLSKAMMINACSCIRQAQRACLKALSSPMACWNSP